MFCLCLVYLRVLSMCCLYVVLCGLCLVYGLSMSCLCLCLVCCLYMSMCCLSFVYVLSMLCLGVYVLYVSCLCLPFLYVLSTCCLCVVYCVVCVLSTFCLCFVEALPRLHLVFFKRILANPSLSCRLPSPQPTAYNSCVHPCFQTDDMLESNIPDKPMAPAHSKTILPPRFSNSCKG